jgi:hypothetical protein
MDIHRGILDFIRIKGPSLPTQIAKHIGKDSLMASVYLSELASTKKILISWLKVGASPLYYLPGQQNKLQNFSSKLNEKDLEAYNLLKEKKIIQEKELSPLYRVAMKNLKDFAEPLNVTFNGGTEIFWKWSLLSEQETKETIQSIVNPIKELPKETKKEETKIEDNNVQEKGAEEKKIDKPIEEKIIPKKEILNNKTEINKETPIKSKEIEEVQQKIIKTEKKEKKNIESDFLNQIEDYFASNGIKIIEKNIIRKTELDFLLSVPSSVGNLTYYCKAKSKIKINDGDLSSAFIQAQSKKLPCFFVTKGDLTKKAQEMLEQEFPGMHIKKI